MRKESDLKKVRDVMTPHVHTVQPSTQFKSIARMMRVDRIGAVPVVDASGRVVGIVSETDLLPKEEPQSALSHHLLESKDRRELRRKAKGLVAADVMTTPAITVTPDTPIRDAVRILVDDHIHHLPVVSPAGDLAGIVSRSDLLRLFAREDESIEEEVGQKVAEATRLLDATKVETQVVDGVVTLTGEIDRKSDDQHVVAIVQAIDGVVGVDDQLRIWWDDTSAGVLEEALLNQYGGSSVGLGW